MTDPEAARLIALNDGAPPPLGTVNTWLGEPAPVVCRPLVELPITTPLVVKVPAPVPPFATAMVPDVMIDAGRFGTSLTLRLVAATTRPLVSTVTLVNVPPAAKVVVRVGLG